MHVCKLFWHLYLTFALRSAIAVLKPQQKPESCNDITPRWIIFPIHIHSESGNSTKLSFTDERPQTHYLSLNIPHLWSKQQQRDSLRTGNAMLLNIVTSVSPLANAKRALLAWSSVIATVNVILW